jgi:hypothetical protein
VDGQPASSPRGPPLVYVARRLLRNTARIIHIRRPITGTPSGAVACCWIAAGLSRLVGWEAG